MSKNTLLAIGAGALVIGLLIAVPKLFIVLIGLAGIAAILLFTYVFLKAAAEVDKQTDELVESLVHNLAEAKGKLSSTTCAKKGEAERYVQEAEQWLRRAQEYRASGSYAPKTVQDAAKAGNQCLEIAVALIATPANP